MGAGWYQSRRNAANGRENRKRQSLFDAIIGKTLAHCNDPTLTEHVTNAVAIETPRGFRLAKERTSRKIDAAVALSMSHYQARQTPGELSDDDRQALQDWCDGVGIWNPYNTADDGCGENVSKE